MNGNSLTVIRPLPRQPGHYPASDSIVGPLSRGEKGRGEGGEGRASPHSRLAGNAVGDPGHRFVSGVDHVLGYGRYQLAGGGVPPEPGLQFGF
mgnify:CR=1 FL=1